MEKIVKKSIEQLTKIVVSSSKYKPSAHDTARMLYDEIKKKNKNVLLDLDSKFDYHAKHSDTELIVAVGGDGTLLSLARRLVGVSIPTIGVNMGKLGFLAEHSPSDVLEYIHGKTSKLTISPKMMLQVKINGNDKPYYALNDVLLAQGVMTKLINIHMHVDDRHATNYFADGVVISTPVGSTSYSLSLGGPILSQGLRSMVITPIAPHRLTDRPIVIEGKSKLKFGIESKRELDELALVMDGQDRVDLKSGDRFSVSAAATDFLLVSSPKKSYFDILRHKLAWGQQLNRK